MYVNPVKFEGRPDDMTGRLEKEQRCYALLDSLQIPYSRVDHDFADTIEAVCKDRLNLLLDISSALSTTKTFVLGLNTRSTEDGFAIIRIEIQIKDGAQLSTLMNKLHQISGVLQVNRPVG